MGLRWLQKIEYEIRKHMPDCVTVQCHNPAPEEPDIRLSGRFNSLRLAQIVDSVNWKKIEMWSKDDKLLSCIVRTGPGAPVHDD